jgi:Acyltransferase family
MPIARDAIHTTQSSVHLDAIRGAAALIVLLGHTRSLFFSSFAGGQRYSIHSSTGQVPVPRPITSPELNISIGNEGVIIFFVLSGYLVGGSAIKAFRQNTWSWNDYLVKRLTRLWVVLLPALVLGVVLDYTGLHLFSHPDSIYSAPPEQQLVYKDLLTRLSVPVIVGNALFLQTIVVAPAGTNDSLWSLANEFWYYLAFPLLLLVLRPDEKRWLRGLYLPHLDPGSPHIGDAAEHPSQGREDFVSGFSVSFAHCVCSGQALPPSEIRGRVDRCAVLCHLSLYGSSSDRKSPDRDIPNDVGILCAYFVYALSFSPSASCVYVRVAQYPLALLAAVATKCGYFRYA